MKRASVWHYLTTSRGDIHAPKSSLSAMGSSAMPLQKASKMIFSGAHICLARLHLTWGKSPQQLLQRGHHCFLRTNFSLQNSCESPDWCLDYCKPKMIHFSTRHQLAHCPSRITHLSPSLLATVKYGSNPLKCWNFPQVSERTRNYSWKPQISETAGVPSL